MVPLYSLLTLVLAGGVAAVALWALAEWQRQRSTLLLFNLLALLAVALEIGVAGAGHWLGAGDDLRDLSGLPLLLTGITLPLTLFTLATIGRRAGLAFARPDWGHGAVCLLAVALLLYGVSQLMTLKLIYPACWHDLVWYLQAVPGFLACTPDQPDMDATRTFPVIRAVVAAAYLGLGLALWRRQTWPWLAVLMLAGVALSLVPLQYGPLARFAGLALGGMGIVLVAVRHGRAAAAAR
jgi:hypothetical protein